MKSYYIFPIFLFLFFSCENKDNSNAQNVDKNQNKSFRSVDNSSIQMYNTEYFSGQAEVATYELKKARYNSTHPGEAVLIFVSEPFLINKQVKADHPTKENSVNVLKMNRIDRFNTGVYDYSQFTSVFTPVQKYDVQYPLKMTLGSQDWCGQSFVQINNNHGFDYNQKSYFESEGDTSLHLDYVLLEDNLFNLARLSIDLLPLGEFTLFPSLSYLRNSHAEIKNYKAIAAMDSTETDFYYVYEIPALRRSVRILISSENQNRILSWEESYPTVFDDEIRTSTYKLKGVEVLPYWKLNKKSDASLRKDLKLLN